MPDSFRLPSQIELGRHEPLGSFARDCGVNFAVFSANAHRLQLCIFDTSGTREIRRYDLHGPTDGIFHGFLPGVGAGLVYGLRAYGPYLPEAGHRFNPNKLLLDPYAKEIVGRFVWQAGHHGYELGNPEGARSFDSRDNAVAALKARVTSGKRPIADRKKSPRIPAADVVLYEVHVRSFSQLNAEIPDRLRGTYAGLAHPVSIAHFKSLGVTTLSLLPVQYHIDEAGLAEKGLTNYWGYNTIGFFCPDPRYSVDHEDPTAVVDEFRQMVEVLHENGLEVVLDVVYNHTPEGNEAGPTISFRGLDNASWYRLKSDDPSRYENLSGCGNTVNVAHPHVTQFVLDSLRYWVIEMGVDGFRFDLAPILGRGRQGFDSQAAFFVALRQDPVLAGVHLIAEPWDSGHDGYQVGRFPGKFLDWNDKFRDAVRAYWIQRGVGRGEFARRFMASSDLFHHGGRLPTASVNYVSVHDGFALADVVSYSRKHNEANGEQNRDGRDGELCANFGSEGQSEDPEINATRLRLQRAMLATLLLSQGTPMLFSGDEIGNSQSGNNNAYCQDNDISWLKWHSANLELARFVSDVIGLRSAEPKLRRNRWYTGQPDNTGPKELTWYTTSGNEMQVNDWHDAGSHAFACVIRDSGDGGSSHLSAALMILFNPEVSSQFFSLPESGWSLALDSSGELVCGHNIVSSDFQVPAHALVVLRGTVRSAGN
jgi:glycogen operon protein